MTNKEQAVSDAMIQAGRAVALEFGLGKPPHADKFLTAIYLAMKAASHPLEQQQAVSEIDLRVSAYERLEEAAAQSNWIPPEYFSNDWIADCAEFLRTGKGIEQAVSGDVVAAVFSESIIDQARRLGISSKGFLHYGPWADAVRKQAICLALTASGVGRMRERNRLMGDVIDFACDHIDQASDAMDFIEAYRSDEWDHYPNFVKWREIQSRTALQEDGRDD